jgi:hypothetical protein
MLLMPNSADGMGVEVFCESYRRSGGMMCAGAARAAENKWGGDMGRRLMLGFCAALLALGTTACSEDGKRAEAVPAAQGTAADNASISRAQECTKTVLAAVTDKMWVDSGQVTDDTESQERNTRLRAFSTAYLGVPEMDIFMRAGSDAVNAINGGSTVTESIASTTGRITEECAEAYP